MATTDSTDRIGDVERCIYGAQTQLGTLKGAFSLLSDDGFSDHMARLFADHDTGIYSRFEAVKVAFATTLKELSTELDAALNLLRALHAATDERSAQGVVAADAEVLQ